VDRNNQGFASADFGIFVGLSFSKGGDLMKVADVKLSWSPSVSGDVVKQVVRVAIDGQTPTTFEVGPSVDSVVIEVKASSSAVFSVESTDADGESVVSELYTFALSDLVAPQPATNLFHEIVAVRDAE
jgi:hypothetical protein